jgi:pimeloyl-ACP methyl ester carboxylesterase
MVYQNINFFSEGSRIAAHLYLPASISTPIPAIILCHGFAGVKELLLPAFASYFSGQGYAALCFDYRGFGESEGDRGRLVPEYQIRDIQNAITYLQSREDIDIDRIALWGSSFGGANAIVTAARDTRVKCLCVQLTFGDGERVITGGMSKEEKTKFIDSIRKMQQKKVTTNKELMVPIHKVLTDEQSKAFYNEKVTAFPALEVKIPFLTVAETMRHKPALFLDDLYIPIHIVSAGNDSVNPPQESQILYEKAHEPKVHLIIEGASHYEVYEGEYFELAANAQIEWFRKYLG